MRYLLPLLLLLYSCQSDKPSNQYSNLQADLDSTALRLSDHFFASPQYMMYDTDFLYAIHYAEVCMAYGLAQYAQTSKNHEIMDRLLSRYRPLLTDSIAWKNHHVDGNVYGILPFKFYQYTRDTAFLRHGLFMADSQWDNPLPDGMTRQTRYWIDDVFMVSSLQLEAFKATSEKKYLERASLFTANYADSLQQENGLFHHGPEAPIYWGRGNGWMAVGLAATISTLPPQDLRYEKIVEAYRKMMKTLLLHQNENGMWRQVIDLPSAWEETSCTAMFAYAMSEGINQGVLVSPEYKEAVLKAWKALAERVNERGALTGVCAGTGQSKDIQYYLDRPRIDGDFHGQAPLIWLINNLQSW